MIKKLLFIFFILFATHILAQVDSDTSDTSSNIVIENLDSIQNIACYPNPFSTKSTISFESSTDQIIIFQLKNLLGKIVYQTKINAQKGLNQLNILRENLPDGMYIYSLQTGAEVFTKRLVIR